MAIPITRAEIPSTALTDLETLAAWATMTLKFMANSQTYQEAEGLTSFLHDSAIQTSYLKENIYTQRGIFQLSEGYEASSTAGLWTNVVPRLDGSIPDSFLE